MKRKKQNIVKVDDLSESKKDKERLVFLCDITLEDFDKFKTLTTFDVMRGFINTYANNNPSIRVGAMYFSFKEDGEFSIVFRPRFYLDERIIEAVNRSTYSNCGVTFFMAHVTNIEEENQHVSYRNPYREENPEDLT